MKNLLSIPAIFLALAAPAFAEGAHDAGHGGAHGGGHAMGHSPAKAAPMGAGQAGAAQDVTRTVQVIMREKDDGGMVFEPSEFAFETGDTIRFEIFNAGELEHEFVLDTPAGNRVHKDAMAQTDMAHDDPNALRLAAGARGEVIWAFTHAGRFEFACLILGHYESGMFGPIVVGGAETGSDPQAMPEHSPPVKP
jgi:uncharacterized cupredoxin-like copper-binding protein